ncbi:MAG: hypothetical protein QOE96_3054, partial [Blastocatellia bacterium]|nr:hypothetical protein [Blastocatellia bacterium]
TALECGDQPFRFLLQPFLTVQESIECPLTTWLKPGANEIKSTVPGSDCIIHIGTELPAISAPRLADSKPANASAKKS